MVINIMNEIAGDGGLNAADIGHDMVDPALTVDAVPIASHAPDADVTILMTPKEAMIDDEGDDEPNEPELVDGDDDDNSDSESSDSIELEQELQELDVLLKDNSGDFANEKEQVPLRRSNHSTAGVRRYDDA